MKENKNTKNRKKKTQTLQGHHRQFGGACVLYSTKEANRQRFCFAWCNLTSVSPGLLIHHSYVVYKRACIMKCQVRSEGEYIRWSSPNLGQQEEGTKAYRIMNSIHVAAFSVWEWISLLHYEQTADFATFFIVITIIVLFRMFFFLSPICLKKASERRIRKNKTKKKEKW